MPNTTNFNWTTPADTDLVKDGALAIRTLANGIDTSLVDLKGGTTNQVLSKATNTDLDFTWTTTPAGIPQTLIDAKGDLIVGSAADTAARLAVGGTNGHVLTVNSSATNGVEWSAPAAGGMTLISTTTLAGTTTLSSIPQTYVNLQLNLFRVKNTSNFDLYAFPNGGSLATDEFSNRATTGTMSFRQDDYIRFTGTAATIQANNQDNGWTLIIYNYTSTTAFKPFTIVGDYYNNGKFVLMTSGVIRDTSALTSLEIYGAGSSNSGTVQLYGVK